MKPILFSTEMVGAILNGRKSVTRRVIKPQPEDVRWCIDSRDGDHFYDTANGSDVWLKPKYQPGDILYVQEAWYYENHMHNLTTGEPDLPSGRYSHRYIYEATNPDYPVDAGVETHSWQSSGDMPREAARIFLRVTGVSVERVQDISEVDAKAEGIRSYWLTKEAGEGAGDWHESSCPPYIGAAKERGADLCYTRLEAYQQLWDSLYAKDGYGWDSNPWVWVYEFVRVV